MKILKGIGIVLLSLTLSAAAAFLTGLIVMLLWNWLVPELFGLKQITYLQGWGLAFLCQILFRSHSGNCEKQSS